MLDSFLFGRMVKLKERNAVLTYFYSVVTLKSATEP